MIQNKFATEEDKKEHILFWWLAVRGIKRGKGSGRCDIGWSI